MAQIKSKFPNRVACNKVPFSLERESLEMLPGNRVAGLWGKRGVTRRQDRVHGVALLSSLFLVPMLEGINWLLMLPDDPLHLKKFCIFRLQLQV